jgi:hypothetical protein
MTTSDQDRVIEQLAAEHCGAKVLPYDKAHLGHDYVLACGWFEDADGGKRMSPWVLIRADGSTTEPARCEIAYALEADDRRSFAAAVSA